MAGLVETARAMRERLDHLIQELVYFENEVAWVRGTGSFDKRMEPKVEPKRVAVAGELCTCLCVCSPMNPALWSTLPIEVLQLVFARLPLPKIIQLRCLSGDWNRTLLGGNSELMRECAQASTARIFALIPFRNENFGLISVRMFDTESNRWYSFQHQLKEDNFVTMCAGDGGLICVVSTAVEKKKSITVFNPSTRQCRSLPVLNVLQNIQPWMVQLVMDRDAKCYKVLVVGEKMGQRVEGCAPRVVAKIYCSGSGVWRSAKAFPDLIFGHRIEWFDFNIDNNEPDTELEPGPSAPCAYDCAGRQCLEFDVDSNPFRQPNFRVGGLESESVKSYAFVKDRLFVLHEGLLSKPWDCGISGKKGFTHYDGYCVSEYQGQKCEPTVWVKLKVHWCDEFDSPPSCNYKMKLYACEGLLLMKATNGVQGSWPGSCQAYRHELTWLYDMSTEKWRAIPGIPPNVTYRADDDHGPRTVSTMFELRWDAVP